jgi:hypothetical protein
LFAWNPNAGRGLAEESAFARTTVPHKPRQQVIAMTSEALQHVKQANTFFEPRAIADGIAVQLWHSEPIILHTKSQIVDPLSLWLRLRNSPDPLVQTVLHEAKENFPWWET